MKHHVAQAAFSALVAEEVLEFKDNLKYRSTLKDTEVFDPIVEEDSRLPKVSTELGSGEEKMEAEFREGKSQDVSPTGPVLEIEFGPPHTNFGSVWSSQKARKFRQIQPTTKVRILCFEWKRICFQTRDVLCSYNMNYEE